MRALAAALVFASVPAGAQQAPETRELIGQLGGRTVLMHLHATAREDGSSRLSGEYVILPLLQQRFVEGERSNQLGVTYLKEGGSPILYGRPGTATLQGTWSGGVFKGARYAMGGQERERFELNEAFPAMDKYSAAVQCELTEGRYRSRLAYAVQSGKLESLAWRSTVAPGGHSCALPGLVQLPFSGGLRFASGGCSVTLRDLGDYVRVNAENCSEYCGSLGYLEPVLVDRRGACRLLRPHSR